MFTWSTVHPCGLKKKKKSLEKSIKTHPGKTALGECCATAVSSKNLMMLVRKRYFHLLPPQAGPSAWLQNLLLGTWPTSPGSLLLSSFFKLHPSASHFATQPREEPSAMLRFSEDTRSFLPDKPELMADLSNGRGVEM